MKITTLEHKAANIESLELIKQSARDFALQYIKPYVMDLSLIHISEPRDGLLSRMPSSA